LWGQIYKKIRLNPIAGGSFFVFKDFWGVKVGYWRTVPGWEQLFMFTDDVHQVVERLGMNLDVR
jgi:hypothetical protein